MGASGNCVRRVDMWSQLRIPTLRREITEVSDESPKPSVEDDKTDASDETQPV